MRLHCNVTLVAPSLRLHLHVDHCRLQYCELSTRIFVVTHSLLRRPTGFQPDHRVTLDVGGCVYSTSLDTLCCVEGSRFSDMLRDVTRTHAGWQLYIDRNGQVLISDFTHWLSSAVIAKLTRALIYKICLADVWVYPGLLASNKHWLWEPSSSSLCKACFRTACRGKILPTAR